jgi:hypothetical protein
LNERRSPMPEGLRPIMSGGGSRPVTDSTHPCPGGTATGSGFLAHRLLGGHEWPSHHRGAVDGSEGWEHDRCGPDRQRQHATRLRAGLAHREGRSPRI